MLLGPIGLLGQVANNCSNYPSQLDSMYYTFWNNEQNTWDISSIRHYNYSENNIIQLLNVNSSTREPQWKWEYYYNSQGNRDYELYSVFSSNSFVPSQKKESEFNSLGKKTSELLNDWKNNAWVFRALYLFEYSDSVLVRQVYQLKNKQGNFYDYIYYNYLYENGRIVEAQTQRASDGYITKKSLYTYNQNGSISELLTLTPIKNIQTNQIEFVPSERRQYSYNQYSLLESVLFDKYNNGSWDPYMNYVYFRNIDFANKVTICHKGKTLCVAKSALPAFLKQGSTLGACPVGNKMFSESTLANKLQQVENINISVFPNPAIKSFTIDGLSSTTKRIEIYNSTGSLVSVIEEFDYKSVTINRNGLPSGSYFINIIGETTNQTKRVILQ
jgi:hypothetical protein